MEPVVLSLNFKYITLQFRYICIFLYKILALLAEASLHEIKR